MDPSLLEFDDFPYQEMPELCQGQVAKKLNIRDIVSLSVSSHATASVVKKAAFRVKDVHVTVDKIDVTLLNDTQLIWTFENSEKKLANYTFRNLVKSAEKQGHHWTTSCDKAGLAYRTAFDNLKSMFKIRELVILELTITKGNANNLENHPMLKDIDSIRKLTIVVNVAVEEEKLQFVLDKLTVDGEYLMVTKQYEGLLNYSKPLPAVKTLSLDNMTGSFFDFTRLNSLTHCTHIHLHYCSTYTDSRMYNQFFRNWQTGSLPNLQILEVVNKIDVKYWYDHLLLDTDYSNWREERENELELDNFFHYAKLKYLIQLFSFRCGKDISRKTDRTEASVVHGDTAPSAFNAFLFVVWGSWIPDAMKVK